MPLNEKSWEGTDFLSFYNQEDYLFKIVHFHYQKYKTLSAFDFFFIVIWKANRSKSLIAKKLLAHGGGYDNLETAVQALFSDLSCAKEAKSRLRVLLEGWKFNIPMASAILTVLFPSDFSVYDYRVCESLECFDKISSSTRFDVIWEQYSAYLLAVQKAVPQYPQLRDKDRYLWGKSFADQLNTDIKLSFKPRDAKSGRSVII